MAKAALRKPESNETGEALTQAQRARGWSLKEFAAQVQRPERQVAAWLAGTEHPQLDTLFAIVSFRQPLILALAQRAGLGVQVTTTITLSEAA